jgi:hypothetical protein
MAVRLQGYGGGILNLPLLCHEKQLGYLEVTVQEKLHSGWPGPFVKVEGCFD